MKKLMIIAALAVASLSSVSARADWEWSPFGVGIVVPAQLPWTTTDIYGLRLTGLWGMNDNVYGVSCGLANSASGETMALEIGGVNAVFDTAAGVQLGVVNYVNAFMGLQLGGINWVNTETYGLQAAFFNCDQGPLTGFAFGGINHATRVEGLQCGFFNFSYDVTGVQIGLVNACDFMHGVQIGFLNLICESRLPMMVVANASF